jgi:hypothetical protein
VDRDQLRLVVDRFFNRSEGPGSQLSPTVPN